VKIETNFDYSMMKAFHNCRRRYYYPYVLNIAPRQEAMSILPGAMEFGSAIDAGLDIAYQIMAMPQRSQKVLFEECFVGAEFRPNRITTVAHAMARKTFEEMWNRTVNKGYTEELGFSLLEEYFSKYFPETFDTVDSQISGPVPLGETYGHEVNLMIKSDRLVWGYDPNRYSIFEVKTTSNPNDVWWAGQEMSYQTDGYVLGVESYTGVNIHSAVIDCIATKQKSNRLNRRPILMSGLRRKLYLRWLHSTIDEIMRLQSETMHRFGHFGGNIHEVCYKATMEGGCPHDLWIENRSNCTDYWRLCEYRSLCENDTHPGALSMYVENPWRPYMAKEDD